MGAAGRTWRRGVWMGKPAISDEMEPPAMGGRRPDLREVTG